MIEKTIRFLKGYVVICVEGHFCERFLNICMRRGIYLSDVKRMGEERICACISINAFREIRSIARKTRTHVRITKRYGLPFLLHRYRKRKIVALGVVLFFAILWYLTSHVMGIDVVGNERIPTADILAGLEELGVCHGTPVKEIDSVSVKNRMMVRFDDIAWVGVSVKGSRVYIEVKERLDTPMRLGTDVPCDIVAEKDGLVKLAEVKDGKTLVRPNQYVGKGDLLVSGVLDSDVMGMRFVHSFGEVYAETVYEKSGEYSFEYTEKIYTGEKKNRYSISFLGKSLDLFINKKRPFENFDVMETTKEYKTPLSFIPSLFVRTNSFDEYKIEKRKRSLEETVDFGGKELSAQLDSELPEDAKVTDRKISYNKTPKGVMVTVKYVCYEDIGSQRIIDKTEVLEYDIVEKK